MSQSHCYISVTSDDMVIVIVISYEIIKKVIKGFGKIILYSI